MSNLRFTQIANPGNKTCRWLITATRTGKQLGYIKFRPTWRKYIWGPLVNCIFDVDCTQEIADFLKAHKDDRQ